VQGSSLVNSSDANPWIGIIGTRAMGRPQIARHVVEALGQQGLSVLGLVSEPVERDGARAGYDLEELGSGARRPLARPGPAPQLCSWAFDDAVFAEAARRVAVGGTDVVVLQFGSLEAAGEGLWPAAAAALAAPRRLLVLTLRPHLLARLIERLPEPADALELPAAADDVQRFVARTVATARAVRGP
jgi:nucleoside-triphosphatase THEP1